MSACSRPEDLDALWGKVETAMEVLARRELIPQYEEQALCAQIPLGNGFDPWFPTSGFDELTPIAKRICGQCPLRAECLAEALHKRVDFGIWGGLTATERQRLAASE